MKILQVYIHYPVCAGRYYTDAFKRLGHDVRHIGQDMYNKIWGINVNPQYNWKADGDQNQYWDDWKPDLILLQDTALTGYRHPYYKDAPMAVVTVDNHVKNTEQDGVAAYFLAHYHGQAQPIDPNRADHIWLPCARDAQWFTPSPLPWHLRAYDVCLVGYPYPRRQHLVNELRKAGLNVMTQLGALYDEYRALYWQSRISLCVSANQDVAQRIFETGALGCAVLTDPLLDLLDPATGQKLALQSYAVYDNDQMCIEVAIELLRLNPQMGQGAARTIAQTCQPHTWEARAKNIVDWHKGKLTKFAPEQEKKPFAQIITDPAVIKMIQEQATREHVPPAPNIGTAL